MLRPFFSAACAIALLAGLPEAARAVAVNGNGTAQNVPYVIGFHPLHSSQTPYLGQMHLNFNHGIVSGTYTDMSIRPGSPFANAHNIPVSGGLSGSQITLNIRQITFRGTLTGEKMSGSATIRGSIYTFAAQQGTPGSGKH
ncbi:MAG: hypothetical protein JO190_07625 [Candidatus Eremiobacteraeota bacterium]|nr:hypothetical protein [Candidatus Eremiobacteraeota bacterium]MBV8498644.1 hypothetical protein [Candidatus Eremiobacteraeota bacterium]